MKLQLTLAWRYLNGRKLRSFLTTLAVIFGVMVIFGMNIILPSMLQGFEANMMAAGGLVDLTITHQSGGAFPLTVASNLDSIEGIRAYSASLNRPVNLPDDFVDGDPAKPDRITALNLVGMDPEAAQTMAAYLIQSGGRFLQEDDTTSTVISQSLADAYGVNLGDTIRLPSLDGTEVLTVVGILPPRTIPGNEEVLVTLSQAQVMTGETGGVNTISVALASLDEAARAATTAAIESALGNEYAVGALQSGSEMFASLKLGQAAFNLFGALALFMGGFIIFNTFRTVVTERRRDIGMLRALGARRGTITGMILIEGILQGLVGSAIGLLLGYLFGAGVLKLAGPAMSSFVHISIGKPIVTPELILTCTMLGVGITVLAGLLPARNASRVTPMDALRPSVAEVEYKQRATAGFIIGLVLLGISIAVLATRNMGAIALGGMLFLIGLILVAPAVLRPIVFVFGRFTAWLYARQGTGDLAQGNLTRQPARVTVTASATMIGLAIVVALGGMSTSLNGMMDSLLHKSLGSDYLFVPPSVAVWNADIGSDEDFTSRLKAIDGVGDISTLRFANTAYNGQPISMLGIDPVAYPKVSGFDFQDGDESAYQDLADGRNMIVNGSFLMSLQVKVGDSLELMTPNGPRTYKIVAHGSDLLNAKVVTAYISQANLAADFNRRDDVFIQMNLLPGVTLEGIDAQIKAVASDYPQYTVIAGKAYIDQMMHLVQAVFVGMYFMLAFLAFPSLIAMLNTLTISVLERTREIGMIRAVGGTRKQVRRMVIAEALLLAAVGTSFGILSGMYLGYVIVTAMGEMFPMPYSFPISGVLAGIAIGLLFGALAAVIPARQAARLQVVEALRYE